VAGADIRRFSADRHGMGLNYVLGIGSGALLVLADTLIFPTIVLALFVSHLTDSPLAIGLVPAIGAGVWFLPQFGASLILRGRRRHLPWATGASAVRAAAIALLAYVGYRADSMGDERLLRSFFICYIAYSLAAGFASVPSGSVIAKAIGTDRRRVFFSQRNLWGGAFALGAGLVIRQVLGPDGSDFPRNYTYLFIAAAIALVAATFLQATMQEPARVANPPGQSTRHAIRDASAVLTDSNYRRFLLFRVLFSLSAIADPFLIVYAFREFDASGSMVGVYVALVVLSRFVANLFWQPLSERRGNRVVLQYTSVIRLLAPLIALMVPYVTKTTLYQDRVTNDNAAIYAFGAVFVAYGVALSGQIVSNFGYVLDIVPAPRRPAAIGLANLILAAVSFIPVAGGSIVKRYGFEEVFLAAAFLGLAAVFAGGALTETSTRTRSAATAWRLRRARP
jgi:hypothetical protein